MVGKTSVVTLVAGVLIAASPFNVSSAERPEVNPQECFDCHEEIRLLRGSGKHGNVGCATCHENLRQHLAASETKPTTLIDDKVCGSCHRDEYHAAWKVSYDGPAHKEKGTPTGRSPMMDKLLPPYGFTYEHNEPRGHLFMVTDQFVVDRFGGGRFRYKNGWYGVTAVGKTWDILEDKGPEFKMGETVKGGNPTCIQCKTSDHILKWKFMGDKDPRAKWDRTSDVVAVAHDTQNPMGCIHCHDPHGAQPRIVRDELINRIEQGTRMFAGKDGKTDLQVISFRNGFRKIGIMKKADSRLMCAQCHVEYACGKGYEFTTGNGVGFEDRRTNHFPLVQVQDILDHYKKLNYYDFKHAVTGARLVKLQHPEAETFAGSVHERAGLGCADCHMPPAGKEGRALSHTVIRPRQHIQEACTRCHPQNTVEQQAYQLESIQNYIRGKIRKAEYWLGYLIDTYSIAKRLGVDETTLARAREKHEQAHVLWEWWTAENSDGFHNPDLARESLAGSITASKEGVALLNKALDERASKGGKEK